MRQQIITGLKKKLLLVEFMEGSHFQIMNLYNGDGQGIFSGEGLLFENTSKIVKVGKLTDITEDQFEILIDNNGITGYYNYVTMSFSCDTAKESFFSKLESLGIVFENKLGEYPTKQNTGLEYGMEYISKQASWEEAQEKVWNKGRTWLFEIM